MNLLFEDMIRVETPNLICRVWREFGGNMDLQIEVEKILMKEGEVEMPAMVEAIAQHAGVNSVEIIYRSNGCGICVHKDWP